MNASVIRLTYAALLPPASSRPKPRSRQTAGRAYGGACSDSRSITAMRHAAWLSLRMIGSDAPRGRKTANQVGASKSASPCSALARFGKAAYTLVRGDVISSWCHFSKEQPMGSKRTSRRELLKGGGALAGGFTLGAVAPALGQTPASGQAPAHDHSMATGSHDYPM